MSFDQARMRFDQARMPFDQAPMPLDQSRMPFDQRGRCIRSNRGLVVALAILASQLLSVAAADTDQVKVGESLPRFKLLQPGVHRYLRYIVKDGRRSAVDIWSRTITFEEKDGRRLMHIVQRWDESADQKTPFFLIQDSWFERGTFRPLTHIRHRERDGKVEIKGYRFLPDKIAGISDLPDNLQKDFTLASPEPSYNFE